MPDTAAEGPAGAAPVPARPARRRGSKLLLAGGALLAALLVAEGITRLLVPEPASDDGGNEGHGAWKAHGFVADDDLEYSFQPGIETRMSLTGAYDVTFRINSQGLRDDHDYATEHPGVTRILLVGDSYVFGTGVELPDTVGKRLEAALAADPLWGRPTEVVAAGVPSYGFDSYAKLIERWRPRLLPDVIVVAVFPGNDLIDYEIKQLDRHTVVNGYIVSEHDAWSYNLRNWSRLAHLLLENWNPHEETYVVRPQHPTPEQLAHLRDTMLPWIDRAVAAAAGLPLVVTVMHGDIPVKAWHEGKLRYTVSPLPEILADWEQRGAIVIDPHQEWLDAPDPVSQYFNKRDGHYNGAGAGLVGEALARGLREKVLPLLSARGGLR